MELLNNIYSVGVRDSDVRVFHGYQTPIGTTYNAYLIIDDKITLIDFVKAPFADEFIDNIKAILGNRQPDYIICNHVEPDHSGALPKTVSEFPNAVIYGTAACERELKAYYPESTYSFNSVKAGDTLSTGKYTFSFIPMPMVHWPDSMSTYLIEEGILFSNDALGQHIGTGEITDEDLSLEKLLDRAGDYYANIVLPFAMPVKKLLSQAASLDLKMICPSHGVILKRYIAQMVEKYIFWSDGGIDPSRAVIVYDTMWGTTKKMAQRLAQELHDESIEAELIKLPDTHYSYAMTRLLEAKYVFVGSPTLNNNMMPSVAAFLTYMKGLKPKNKVGMAFGSYGWSGESPIQVEAILRDCGFEMRETRKAVWNIA